MRQHISPFIVSIMISFMFSRSLFVTWLFSRPCGVLSHRKGTATSEMNYRDDIQNSFRVL